MVVHPHEPGRRLRRRARPRVRPRTRSAASTARPTAARPGSGCCSRTTTPARRDVALRPEQPARPLRRPVAGAPPAVGADQRRPRQRPVRLARRRRHLEAARAGREKRGLPERRRGARSAWPSPRRTRRRVYALIEAEKGGLFRSDDGGETWTRVNDDRERAPAGLVLLDAHRRPDERRRRLVPAGAAARGASTAARRSSASRGLAPRRPPRPLDRPEEPEADDRRQRRRRGHLAPTAARRGSPPPLPISQFYHVDGRQRASRTASRAPCRTSARRQRARATAWAARHPRRRLVRRRRRRGGPRRRRPDDPDIVYAGEYGGYIYALRPPHAAGPERRRLPVQPVRPSAPRT